MGEADGFTGSDQLATSAPEHGEVGVVPGDGTSEPTTPSRIGPYRIISKLGEGGMGVVYLAEQAEPVARQVALKVMRTAVDDRELLLRFHAERQALARLTHPNIAQLYEAGTTAEGFPFFAMELIKGESVITYCDQRRLPLGQRLAVFQAICDGVQHAHQKGVLHRDLKPANILLSEFQGKPVPKIIDFGIAKALDQPLVDATLLTGERVIGTPAYLSPEAVDGGPDVDTRSDVYSLGVLLYELLVGVRPFETKGEKFIQILRKISEEDPTGPSTRWTTLDADSKLKIAEERGLETPALRRRLKGDLDWIVLKAIAKERTQRYGSPAELAADIGRHLRHEPVVAGPPSALYRLGKFVRRHRGLVAAAALLGIVAAKYTVDLRTEQQRTLIALEEAEQARSEAQQISDFLVEVFEVSDPGEARGNEVTAREILDQSAARLDQELADQPLTRARLFATIGTVYNGLGLYRQATEMQERALTIHRGQSQGDSLQLATAVHRLGHLYYMLDRYDEATELLGEALEMQRRLLPTDHPDIAATMENLGRIRFDQGRLDEARDLLERALDIHRQTAEPNVEDHAFTLMTLAEVLTDQDEYDRAHPLLGEAVTRIEQGLGSDHPRLATALEALGSFYIGQNRTGEAADLFRRSLAIREKTLGPDHPDLAISAAFFGSLSAAEGRFDEAEQRLTQALEIFERTLGPDHFNVGANLLFLGELYLNIGRHDEAEAAYRRSLGIWQAAGLQDSSNAVAARAGLAEVAAARRGDTAAQAR